MVFVPTLPLAPSSETKACKRNNGTRLSRREVECFGGSRKELLGIGRIHGISRNIAYYLENAKEKLGLRVGLRGTLDHSACVARCVRYNCDPKMPAICRGAEARRRCPTLRSYNIAGYPVRLFGMAAAFLTATPRTSRRTPCLRRRTLSPRHIWPCDGGLRSMHGRRASRPTCRRDGRRRSRRR